MTGRFDLEEERRFLLDSLRDLEREHDKGDIDEDDYQSLRDDYTARAAEVLRALDEVRADGAELVDEEPSDRPLRRRRVVAWVLIAGMVALTGASLLVLLGGAEPADRTPTTPAEQLALAHQYDSQGEAVEALKLYDAVLRDDPTNAEALAYRGWLLKRAGLVDEAQAALDRAVAADPSYPDAHFFRGMVLYQDRKDPAAAIPEFERFLASDPPPETRGAVQGVLDRAKRDLATPPG